MSRRRIALVIGLVALVAVPITLRSRFSGRAGGEGDDQGGCGGGEAEANNQTTTLPARPVEKALTRPTGADAAVKSPPEMCLKPAGATRKEQVCWRYLCDADPERAAKWSGDANACTPGEVDAEAADHALRRVNAHRFIAGVPPVTLEPKFAAAAQQCALIAHAEGKLSHNPLPSAKCFTEPGAKISAGSLVANRSAARSIAAYFEDPGNETTMVHRRWLLDEKLGIITLGSTDKFSCLVVDGAGDGEATATAPPPRGWSAWPPDGPVPMSVFRDEKLDTAGWTVQSTKEDLEGATVTVKSGGQTLPVTLTHLTPLLGSKSAIRFVPQGWAVEVGKTYEVQVTGTAAMTFTVEPTDC